MKAAATAGCVGDDAVLSLSQEEGLPQTVRTLLGDVYRAKLGIFGGPAGAVSRAVNLAGATAAAIAPTPRRRIPGRGRLQQASPPPPALMAGESDDDGGGGGNGGSSLALHKSAKQWLEKCVNSSAIEILLPSSEYWRTRLHFRFYKHLECVLKRYGSTAKTALDVGSSLPPYLIALPWLTSRTILGPRFAGNVGKGGKEILSIKRIEEKFGVVAIQADFEEWQPAEGTQTLYDLVLCSEVVEHVPRPKEFVRKLLSHAKLLVLSVPYKWAACENTKCHHLNNKITRDKIASWAGRQPTAYDIVEEESGEQRIICVYR